MTLEEAQEQILQLEDHIKNIKNEKEVMTKELEEKRKRESELVEYNQKLYLRLTTQKVDDNAAEQEEENEIINYVGKELFEQLGNKEKRILDTILKGEDE